MSIEHLDILHEELPELFQPRDLPQSWDDDFIIIAVTDPELISDPLPPRNDTIAPDYRDVDEFRVWESGAAGLSESATRPPELSSQIIEILGVAHSGAPVPYTNPEQMPPPECFAFYLPFHYYHPTWWVVYLLLDGVWWLANEIVRQSNNTVEKFRAIQAARLFLYHHEAFHHKTECFATRLELTHRKPFYKTGFERFFQKTFGTNDCLEEGLANASALKDSQKKHKDGTMNQALEDYVLECPPGYNRGVEIKRTFDAVRCDFAERNQHICLPHLPQKNPKVWYAAPHLFNGISNIKSRVNYVIPRSSPLAARSQFRPLLSPGKLVKRLQEQVGLQFVRNGGNHDVYQIKSGARISIPRHQRDLSRGLMHKILREAGITMGLDEFLRQ